MFFKLFSLENHHQTTIWKNCFNFFQASSANPSSLALDESWFFSWSAGFVHGFLSLLVVQPVALDQRRIAGGFKHSCLFSLWNLGKDSIFWWTYSTTRNQPQPINHPSPKISQDLNSCDSPFFGGVQTMILRLLYLLSTQFPLGSMWLVHLPTNLPNKYQPNVWVNIPAPRKSYGFCENRKGPSTKPSWESKGTPQCHPPRE